MCHLILDSIRNHYVLISNKKNVLDDWDYLDDFSDAADNDELSEIDDNEWFLEVYERHQKFFHEAECAPSDSLHDPNSPIILEFVFRDPRRDEVAGRCTDINVHWTQTGELARLHTSALSLVSQLPGEYRPESSKRYLMFLKMIWLRYVRVETYKTTLVQSLLTRLR